MNFEEAPDDMYLWKYLLVAHWNIVSVLRATSWSVSRYAGARSQERETNM
jgi:hypothetical protein